MAEPSTPEPVERFEIAVHAILSLLDAVSASASTGFKLPEDWGRYDEYVTTLNETRDDVAEWLNRVGQRTQPDADKIVKDIIAGCVRAKAQATPGGPPWEDYWKSQVPRERNAVYEALAPLRQCHIRARRATETPAGPAATAEPGEGERPKRRQREPATIWFHGGVSYSKDRLTPVIASQEMHNLLEKFLDGDQAFDTPTLEATGVSNVADVVGKI
jgi:hypothetical protein